MSIMSFKISNVFYLTLAGCALMLAGTLAMAQVDSKRPSPPGAATPPSQRVPATLSERPPHTDPTTMTVPDDAIQFYRDARFRDDVVQVDKVTAAHAAATPEDLPGPGMKDALSSIRWNLPTGVVVILYEDAGGKGEQLALWGSGETDSLAKWDFDNKASRWAWFYLGGDASASEQVKKGLATGPYKAEAPPPALAANSMRLFVDDNYKNTMAEVPSVTAAPMGQMQNLPGSLKDSMSSLQWNLPEGVVVVFYQDAGGLKQQAAVFGKGQLHDIDLWDFNDKVSRWAWFRLSGTGAADSPAKRAE